jgi:hypothetical protein
MRSTAATDSKRPRSRKTSIATLLALLALGAGAQALAPAGAAAVANQPTDTLCALIGGSWLSGGCFIEDGSGGTIRVNEISVGVGRDPASGPTCTRCNLPQQIEDGAGKGGEVAKPDPKGKGLGLKPEASGKKPVKKDKPKKSKTAEDPKKRMCIGLLQKVTTDRKKFDEAAKAFQVTTHGEGTADFNVVMNLLAERDAFAARFGKTRNVYNAKGCESTTGVVPPIP